ncbi:AT hook motif protein [Streptomyces sp. NPDC058662]|uniref:AT hook motif protein n=1 Tax=Streptomyces sp. NPDC058662 TaxID=3346583 RepID=UPI00364CC9A6
MTPPGSTPPPPGPDEASGPERGEPGEDGGAPAAAPRPSARQARKQVLLRLDPQVYDALARWAGEELRSANAQIEFLLRRALSEAGRLPSAPGPIPRRGRPPRPADRPPD